MVTVFKNAWEDDMKITPHTRQLIIGTMGLIGSIAAIGWMIGKIDTNDVLLVILPLFTGYFSLLQGDGD